MTAGDPDQRSTAFTAASVPENYSIRLAPVLFEPWAEVLLDAVGVAAGDRVLDVASGTGVVARAAARRAGPHAESSRPQRRRPPQRFRLTAHSPPARRFRLSAHSPPARRFRLTAHSPPTPR